MKETEQIYVINQPRHFTTTYLVMNTNTFPLSPVAHDKMKELCDFSDVVLIFSATKFPAQKFLDFDKFSSLYETCAWIESSGNLGKTLLKALDYDREIFENHNNFILLNSNDLVILDVNKLQSLIPSTLAVPVFKIRRLGPGEFADIYTLPCEDDGSENKCLPMKFVDCVLTTFGARPEREDLGAFRLDRKYCSYTVSSPVMFFRRPVIDTILNLLLEHGNQRMENFIESFKEEHDFRYFIGSMMKFLGLENFDYDYTEVNV